MLALILDARTALDGANEGIRLCLYSVIPSLFPFLVLSILLTGILSGSRIGFLRPLGRLCGIPEGAESLLAVGLLGGYPVGAQSIAQLHREGHLSRKDARRMLGFCNNAGPAFLFGIIAPQFSDTSAVWKLWLIHILSALFVGVILPGCPTGRIQAGSTAPITVSGAVSQAIRVMAQICGWVVLFRVLIAFLGKWLLWLLPAELQVVILGLLELTNGCCCLSEICSEELRFIAASVMVSFGGLCVWMQTGSVTGDLGLGSFLPGKLIQTAVSALLAVLTVGYGIGSVFFLGIFGIFCRELKKRSRNSQPVGVQ